MGCDSCVYYEWDEDAEEYFCSVDMDEDDYARLMNAPRHNSLQCPYWRSDDEYAVVAHQAF